MQRVLPKYDLDKIKFATDEPTFKKAIDLYEHNKVTQFKEELNGFFATVLGTKPYKVYVDGRHYDMGDCECYLGRRDVLCKHMVAVAIYAVMRGKKLSQQDRALISKPTCSKKLGKLSEKELSRVKKVITASIRYIKAYEGPSRIWFSYQNSLDEGVNRLSKLASDLPVSLQTAELLVNMLLRLDKKLSFGGVDDSNGTVGGFIEGVVIVLQEYAKLDNRCIQAFKKLCNQRTCFDWEEDLVKIFRKKS